MERRLGSDFGDVRVHTGAPAHESATSVGASAYTVGSDVVFQNGQYDPESDQGRHTLAHELTHVVQQRSGPVDGSPVAGGVSVSDPDDRFERAASASADRAMEDSAPA
jgi:Zn-dependent peptidase ImmA (M78 family)